jgi:hypothetical protein
MSTIEGLQRDCAYCRQPITLKFKDGLVSSDGVCLIVDQVFHDVCRRGSGMVPGLGALPLRLPEPSRRGVRCALRPPRLNQPQPL